MKFSNVSSSAGLATTVSLVLCQLAQADVLVLKNGDRITGDIQRIWDSEVTIEPGYSDEFDVDLSPVEFIESEREFEIELQDGREVLASLDFNYQTHPAEGVENEDVALLFGVSAEL